MKKAVRHIAIPVLLASAVGLFVLVRPTPSCACLTEIDWSPNGDAAFPGDGVVVSLRGDVYFYSIPMVWPLKLHFEKYISAARPTLLATQPQK